MHGGRSPAWLSALFAYCTLLLLKEDLGLVLATAAALLLLRDGVRPPAWALAGLGVLTGVEVLAKITPGLGVAFATVCVVLGLPERRRSAIGAGGAALGALVVCWATTGQALAALPDPSSRPSPRLPGHTS